MRTGMCGEKRDGDRYAGEEEERKSKVGWIVLRTD